MRWSSKRAARRHSREFRYLVLIVSTFLVAFISGRVFRGAVADGLDAILALDPSQSARAAALLGWAVAFSLPIYGLVVSWFDTPLKVFGWTWPLATVLVVPALAFLPGRATTNRADDIATEYYFLGSFFDTYYLGIYALFSIGAAALATVLLAPRRNYDADLDAETLTELRSGPDAHLFPVYDQNRFDRMKESRAAWWVRRMLVRLVTLGWVLGALRYALTF